MKYFWSAHHDLRPVRLSPDTARYLSLKHVKQAAKSTVDIETIKPEIDGIKTLNSTTWSIQYKEGHTLLQVYI